MLNMYRQMFQVYAKKYETEIDVYVGKHTFEKFFLFVFKLSRT